MKTILFISAIAYFQFVLATHLLSSLDAIIRTNYYAVPGFEKTIQKHLILMVDNKTDPLETQNYYKLFDDSLKYNKPLMSIESYYDLAQIFVEQLHDTRIFIDIHAFINDQISKHKLAYSYQLASRYLSIVTNNNLFIKLDHSVQDIIIQDANTIWNNMHKLNHHHKSETKLVSQLLTIYNCGNQTAKMNELLSSRWFSFGPHKGYLEKHLLHLNELIPKVRDWRGKMLWVEQMVAALWNCMERNLLVPQNRYYTELMLQIINRFQHKSIILAVFKPAIHKDISWVSDYSENIDLKGLISTLIYYIINAKSEMLHSNRIRHSMALLNELTFKLFGKTISYTFNSIEYPTLVKDLNEIVQSGKYLEFNQDPFHGHLWQYLMRKHFSLALGNDNQNQEILEKTTYYRLWNDTVIFKQSVMVLDLYTFLMKIFLEKFHDHETFGQIYFWLVQQLNQKEWDQSTYLIFVRLSYTFTSTMIDYNSLTRMYAIEEDLESIWRTILLHNQLNMSYYDQPWVQLQAQLLSKILRLFIQTKSLNKVNQFVKSKYFIYVVDDRYLPTELNMMKSLLHFLKRILPVIQKQSKKMAIFGDILTAINGYMDTNPNIQNSYFIHVFEIVNKFGDIDIILLMLRSLDAKLEFISQHGYSESVDQTLLRQRNLKKAFDILSKYVVTSEKIRWSNIENLDNDEVDLLESLMQSIMNRVKVIFKNIDGNATLSTIQDQVDKIKMEKRSRFSDQYLAFV